MDDSEALRAAVRECTDDELLYRIAKRAPNDKMFSFGDIAAAGIGSDDYRYAVISSDIRGRRTLIHDLAVSRELDKELAVRILLTDPDGENKKEALNFIDNEALLMLAFLNSVSARETAGERLKELGSGYPDLYMQMEQDERALKEKQWYALACAYAEGLIDEDRTISGRLGLSVSIDSFMLIGFLAACHPDRTVRTRYAEKIVSERLAAYVGAITEYADVKKILARRIWALDHLPYCGSDVNAPLLITDKQENRNALCFEILRSTDSEDMRRYLTERLKEAGIKIPKELKG